MKKYIVILSFAFLMGCSEEFLSVDNPNALTPSAFPTSAADLESILIGVYGTQHGYGLYGHTILAKGYHVWDHTMNLAWQGTQTWINQAQNDTRPSDEFLKDIWKDSYKGVIRANSLLESVEGFRSGEVKPATTVTGDQLDKFEGQALYLRAWFYYNLIIIFGEDMIINGQGRDAMGVPIVLKTANSVSETFVGRASVGEVWDQIKDDLQKSLALMGTTTWSGADRFKINQWGLKGLLGKMYALTGDWETAKGYLKDVIDNSGKSLVPFNVYKNMYNSDPANEFNSESLIEIALEDDNVGRSNDETSLGSWYASIVAPSIVINDLPLASSWSNEFIHEKNLARFGFTQAHYFQDGVVEPRASNVRPGYVTEALALRADPLNSPVDPRLYIAGFQPYADSIMADGKKTAISHFADGVEVNRPAWSFRKYVNVTERQRLIRDSGANFYLLRLADVYLLYAEASIETGDIATGLEYINKVHRRAYNLPVDVPHPSDYVTLTDATKAVGDPELGNNVLRYERFVELFGEGQKWTDTRRWKNGSAEAAIYQTVRGGMINWEDTDYAQPIPTLEIENNVAINFSDQNPGY
ncbi:MAG: RagB/SusD family nutrient uptake outer membrane protein [Imperialibacter sp.]|uniref:RagB/SusD family nutrient uptake outer membrane protein n=1 Tax=Imperialibacter sp. TaxID=2038411 RepID=UPI0032ED1EC6